MREAYLQHLAGLVNLVSGLSDGAVDDDLVDLDLSHLVFRLVCLLSRHLFQIYNSTIALLLKLS